MKRRILFLLLVCMAGLLINGCAMLTVDEMYRPPKRSEQYNHLQSAIDQAMAGREYCAPLSGENRQPVQSADLDGDGNPEYLLFAKSGSEKPLEILIFRQTEERYVLSETISGSGLAFDRVEYVQVDGKRGMELVVGKQVSDQILRTVSVYSFAGGQAEQLVAANYAYFLTVDLDSDKCSELMVLHPGSSESGRGVAVLYGMEQGVMGRSNEVELSEPVDKLKRVITGRLHGGTPAVFVGSAVEESAIITDVFSIVNGVFTNVSLSNESGTSVQTLRNFYVYADDIDDDGEVELPDLIDILAREEDRPSSRHCMIRWYAMTPQGDEVDKLYTFHNFVGGWYLSLDADWAYRITVEQVGSAYEFYLKDETGENFVKILTVYGFTGQNREELANQDNRFVLYRGESTVYSAYLEVASGVIDITQEDLINGFHLIRQDWKTGET